MSVPFLRYQFKDIDKSDDFLKITSFTYQPPGLAASATSFALPSTQTSSYKKSRGIVILPIPENIADANGAGWGSGNMGPLQTALLGAAGNIINANTNIGRNVGGEVKKLFQKSMGAAISKDGQRTIETGLAGLAVGALTGQNDANQNLSRATGAIFNSNTELLFNGVVLRGGFPFSFNLTPRSQIESLMVRDIIRFFKIESAVQKGREKGNAAGLFLKSPSVFKIQYMSGGKSHPWLNEFKICALTNMAVKYTGSGTYATYSDGAPVHMILSLSFQELTPIYREYYVAPGGGLNEILQSLRGTGF